MNVAPIVVSRSAIVTRKLCEMKRYRNYHQPHPDFPATEQVGGLVPCEELDKSHLAKQRGIWLHGCLEQMIKGNDWEAWLKEQVTPQQVALLLTNAPNDMLQEQILLVRRATIGWKHQRGHLLDQYTPVSAEEEWSWGMSPMVAQTLRLDQIWRNKESGQLLIVDFKSLGRPDANWIDRLRNSDQTHLYIQALTERSGERIEGIQYEGIVIGKFEDGIQKSPIVRAYENPRSGVKSAKWTSGSTMVSTKDWPDSTWLSWISSLGALGDLYPTTGVLNPPPAQLLQTKASTVRAEMEWADKVAQIEAEPDPEAQEHKLHMLVERNADACLKFGWGYACPYMGLCWDGATPDSESYSPRIDHHAIEEAK